MNRSRKLKEEIMNKKSVRYLGIILVFILMFTGCQKPDLVEHKETIQLIEQGSSETVDESKDDLEMVVEQEKPVLQLL